MSNKDKQQAGQVGQAAQAGTDQATELDKLRQQVQAYQAQIEQLHQEIEQLKANGKQQEPNGAQAAPPKSGTHIRVAALSDGYFRAGQAFSRQAREVAISDLTKEQLQAIRNDARLVVVDL